MSELLDRLGARTTGIILLAIAAVLLGSAAWIAYAATNRWLAVSYLEDYHLERLAGNATAAAAAAKEAAALLHHDAAAVLPAIDLASAAGQQELEHLVGAVPAAQRPSVQVAASLAAVLNGQAPAAVGGGDGALISALAGLPKDGAPAPLQLPAEDAPPHATVLAVVLARRFQAAWTSGDASAIRQCAGPLLLLAPRHPEAAKLRALLATLGEIADDHLRPLLDAITDSHDRQAFVRLLCRLAPSRTTALLAAIPSEQRTAGERQQALLRSDGPLEVVVKNALASPDETVAEALLPRCLSAGRIDLARSLVPLLRAERRTPATLAIALADGDLAAIAALAGERPDFALRISTPVMSPGRLAFHLSTTSGVIPRTSIEIRLAGRVLPPERVERYASLVVADAGDAADVPYEVRVGERVIASGRFTP